MFHRPKSEDQETEQQTNKPQEASVAKEQGTTTEQQTQTEQTVKEEKIMSNEQPDNQEEGQSVEASVGAPFQRPPQMQRTVPAGGFSSGGYASTSAPSYDAGTGESSRLVIGRGITMSGEIEACDHLLVEGTLEAALKGARVLEIANSGVFYGAVEIEEATVAGRFEGELTVNGRLTIKEGGSVTGAVAYKELAVEAGATLDGKLSPLASAGSARADSTQGSRKPMAPRNDNAGEQSASEQLPFSGNAAAGGSK